MATSLAQNTTLKRLELGSDSLTKYKDAKLFAQHLMLGAAGSSTLTEVCIGFSSWWRDYHIQSECACFLHCLTPWSNSVGTCFCTFSISEGHYHSVHYYVQLNFEMSHKRIMANTLMLPECSYSHCRHRRYTSIYIIQTRCIRYIIIFVYSPLFMAMAAIGR